MHGQTSVDVPKRWKYIALLIQAQIYGYEVVYIQFWTWLYNSEVVTLYKYINYDDH